MLSSKQPLRMVFGLELLISKTRQGYPCTPLLDKLSLRVLAIENVEHAKHDEVHCGIETNPVGNYPQQLATTALGGNTTLSDVGDERRNPCKVIILLQKLLFKQNLSDSLLQFRLSGFQPPLWIDAISIGHNDLNECSDDQFNTMADTNMVMPQH